MSIVHPDAYIVDIVGPFQGSLNDANITKEIFETNNSLVEWLGGSGQMIIDRGFRDVIDVFVSLGYGAHMPAFLKKGDKQHQTIDINNTRLSTKSKWVVEVFHSRLKKWKFLDDRIHNSLIPKLKVL